MNYLLAVTVGSIAAETAIVARTKRVGARGVPNSREPDGVRRVRGMTMSRVVWILWAALLLTALPAAAQPPDCSSLPASAQRARTCNPQQECMAQVEKSLKGPAVDSGRRDCQRLPTSGTCYGPEVYNPQAECRDRQRRK
jgi:hypothetical protein